MPDNPATPRVLAGPDEYDALPFYFLLADRHLDGYRLERSSSKTSPRDRLLSDKTTTPVVPGEVAEGDFRAKTGNGPWIRSDTAVGALRAILRRRKGERWLREMGEPLTAERQEGA